MKSKLRHLLMAFLLLAQILVAPAGLVKGAEETDKITTQLTLTSKSASIQTEPFKANDLIEFGSSVSVPGKKEVDPPLTDGILRLTIPKLNFEMPSVSKDTIFNSATVDTESDSKNYIIDYALREVSAGTKIEITSTANLSKYNVGLPVTIKQELINQTNNQVIDSAEAGFTPRVDTPKVKIADVDQVFTTKFLNAADQLIDPFNSQFTFQAGVIDMPGKDKRDFNFSVVFPVGLDFVATASDSRWQYDEASRTASIRLNYLTMVQSNGLVKYPVLAYQVPAGAQVPNEAGLKLDFKNTFVDQTDPFFSGTATVKLKKEDTTPVLPDTRTTFEGKNQISGRYSNSIGLKNFSKETRTIVEVLTKFSEERTLPVNSISIRPRKESNFLKGYVEEQNGVSIEAMSTDAYKNRVIGLDTNGNETVLATNVGKERIDFSADKIKTYQEIRIEFDQDINVANNTITFQVYGQIIQPLIDKFSLSTAEYMQLTNDGFINNNEKGKVPGSLTLNKTKLPTIAGIFLRKDLTDTLLPGNVMNLNVRIRFTEIPSTGGPILEDARVYYLLPDGLSYDDQDQGSIKGFSDVQVIPNYQGTGRTAVVGTPSGIFDGAHGSEYDYLNRVGYYDFNLPVRMGEAFTYLKEYELYAYLYLKNNNGTYSSDPTLGDSSGNAYKISASSNSKIPYGDLIYQNSADPTAVVAANNKFSFAPLKKLYSNSFVKKVDGSTFVSNLSQEGKIRDALTYRLHLFNNSDAPIDSLGMINVLPTVADGHSEFPIKITGPVTFQTNDLNSDYKLSDFEVLYSEDEPTTIAEDYQKANWISQPADYSKITMIRIRAKKDILLNQQAEINFDYPAVIPDDDQISDFSKSYNNFYTITGKPTTINDKHFTASTTATVSVNYQSVVTIKKVSSADQQPLNGAEFQLYHNSGSLVSDRIYKSEKNGGFQITDLTPGDYYLKEVKAPIGYQLPSNNSGQADTHFTVTGAQEQDIALTIANDPIQGSLSLTAQDQDTQELLAGAKFGLYLNGVQVQELTSTTEISLLDKLLPGVYTIKVLTAPVGYKLNDAAEQNFKIDQDHKDAKITFNFQKLPVQGQVTVHYQDVDGNQIADPEVLKGEVGTEYLAVEKAVADYTRKEVIGDIKGEFTVADQEVTFIYEKETSPEPVAQGQVTVYYQDVEGKKIADSEVLKGEVGTEYQAVEKAVANYTRKEVIGDIKGEFTAANQEVTFVYEKETPPEPVAQGKVTVHYQDVDGNQIADPEVLEGEVGTEYHAEKKPVAGYTFKEGIGADSGQFTAANQEVIFIYERVVAPVAQGKVTVHYQDVDGNQIADSEELKGNVGTEYHAEEKAITGYDFKEVKVLNNRSQTGHFTEVPQELVFVYQKQAVTPEKPDEVDPQPEQPKQPDKATSANKVTKQTEKAKSKQARLPQAGNRESMSALLIGSILFLLIGVVIIKKEIEQ